MKIPFLKNKKEIEEIKPIRETPYRDKKLFDMVIKKEERATKAIKQSEIQNEWLKYERMYENDAWHGSKRPEYLTRFQSNNLFENTEAVLPIIISRVPRPEITPKPKSLDEESLKKANQYAKGIQRELIDIWERTDMQIKQQMGFREFNIKGKYFLKSTYDSKDKKFYNGICDIRTIKPDPNANSIENCEDTWFIHAYTKPTSWVREYFGIDVEPEGELNDRGEFVIFPREQTKLLDKSYGLVRIFDLYINDFSKKYDEDYIDKDKNMEYNKDEKRIKKVKEVLRYAKGKKIIKIIPSYTDFIIEDKENPYGRIPIFECTNYGRSEEFWGTSDGKNIKDHTLAINMIVSNIVDSIKTTGNPQKEKLLSGMADTDIVVDNEPGRVYDVMQLGTIRNLETPRVPQYIPQTVEWLSKDIDRKSGITDAFRAESKAGDSGVKVRSLISQATGRLQPKVTSFVRMTKQLYKHWALIIQKYYPDTIIQKAGDKEGIAQFEEFKPLDGKDIELDVKVSALSMLPFDNYLEFEEAQVLFGAESISREQLIDTAPTLRDKQRAKEWVAERQEQMAGEEQKVQAMQQFTQLAEQASDIFEQQDLNTPELDELVVNMIKIASQFTDVIKSNEFVALPEDLKKAIVMGIMGIGPIPSPTKTTE